MDDKPLEKIGKDAVERLEFYIQFVAQLRQILEVETFREVEMTVRMMKQENRSLRAQINELTEQKSAIL